MSHRAAAYLTPLATSRLGGFGAYTVHKLLEQRIPQGPPAAIRVKVTPKSSKTEITGELADGTLKIRVAAPPERGKANAELCAFLAREIGVASAKVEVVSGHTASLKLVRVSR